MVSIPGEIQKRFDARIRRITSAGIQLPTEFKELQARAKSRHIAGTPMRDRYVAALVADDQSADLPALWAAALAEACADNHLRAAVDEGVRDGINQTLRKLYAPHALRVYDELAARFNAVAEQFRAAAQAIDPEATAERVLDASAAAQKAWKAAVGHAREMTDLLPALCAAALLAGVGDFDANPDETLALVVETDGHDRQQVWAAWDTAEREREAAAIAAAGDIFSRPTVSPSRTGRWGALTKLGATIRAADLNQFEAYSRRDEPEFAPNTTTHLGRVPDLLLHRAAP